VAARARRNDAGVAAARRLITAGKVTDEALSAAEEKSLLAVRDACLAELDGGGFAYPVANGGAVYRRSVIAAKRGASQQGQRAVFDAAAELLEEIDGDAGRAVVLLARELGEAAAGAAYGRARVDLQANRPADGEAWPERQRVQLFPWGKVEPVDGRGPWHVDARSAESIAAVFNGRSRDFNFNFDHIGGRGRPESSAAPASGWIEALEVVAPAPGAAATAEHGVWASVLWTPRARQALADREFRYVSPEFFHDAEGVVLAVVGGALTNAPAIHGMLPVAAHTITDRNAEELGDGSAADSGAGQKGGDMSEELKALGFATVEDAKTALAELRAKADKHGELEAKLATVEKSAAELEKAKRAQEIELAIATGRQSGKVHEGNEAKLRELAARNFDAFTAALELLPEPEASGGKRLPVTTAKTGGQRFSLRLPHNVEADMDPEELAEVEKALEIQARDKVSFDVALARVERGEV